jgi:hypothetical protein
MHSECGYGSIEGVLTRCRNVAPLLRELLKFGAGQIILALSPITLVDRSGEEPRIYLDHNASSCVIEWPNGESRFLQQR